MIDQILTLEELKQLIRIDPDVRIIRYKEGPRAVVEMQFPLSPEVLRAAIKEGVLEKVVSFGFDRLYLPTTEAISE